MFVLATDLLQREKVNHEQPDQEKHPPRLFIIIIIF